VGIAFDKARFTADLARYEAEFLEDLQHYLALETRLPLEWEKPRDTESLRSAAPTLVSNFLLFERWYDLESTRRRDYFRKPIFSVGLTIESRTALHSFGPIPERFTLTPRTMYERQPEDPTKVLVDDRVHHLCDILAGRHDLIYCI
jgi:hypothetical protein